MQVPGKERNERPALLLCTVLKNSCSSLPCLGLRNTLSTSSGIASFFALNSSYITLGMVYMKASACLCQGIWSSLHKFVSNQRPTLIWRASSSISPWSLPSSILTHVPSLKSFLSNLYLQLQIKNNLAHCQIFSRISCSCTTMQWVFIVSSMCRSIPTCSAELDDWCAIIDKRRASLHACMHGDKSISTFFFLINNVSVYISDKVQTLG